MAVLVRIMTSGEELYEMVPPKLAGGAAPPQPNASWARRQNSMMWSAEQAVG